MTFCTFIQNKCYKMIYSCLVLLLFDILVVNLYCYYCICIMVISKPLIYHRVLYMNVNLNPGFYLRQRLHDIYEAILNTRSCPNSLPTMINVTSWNPILSNPTRPVFTSRRTEYDHSNHRYTYTMKKRKPQLGLLPRPPLFHTQTHLYCSYTRMQ